MTNERFQRAKAGDRAAFEELLKAHAARVHHIARIRLGPALRAKMDSQDIVQEAFLRALKGFSGFEATNEGGFLHWMSRLVENAIRDQSDRFTAKKRAMGSELPMAPAEDDAAAPPTYPGHDPTPSQWLVAQESLDALFAALDSLPPDAREAVVHRDMEGLSFAEVGQLLGRSEDAARMLYVRAKAKLTGLMRPTP